VNPKIMLPDGLIDCDEGLIGLVLDAATNVHRQFGPGLLESVYELALMIELAEMKIPAQRQVEIPVKYHGTILALAFALTSSWPPVYYWRTKL
jgi:hypothetical protein